MRSASLTTKLLGTCSVSLVIMFLSCLYSFMETSASEEQKILDNWFQKVDEMEAKIGAQFFERYGDVQAWSLNTVFQGKNTQDMARILNGYISVYVIYDLIMVVDLNGQLIASSTVDSRNNPLDPQALSDLAKQNYANAPWFTNVINERYTEDSKKGFSGVFMEDIMIDPLSTLAYRKKHIGVSFSSPVRDSNGKMIAVMTSRSSLQWVEDRFVDVYTDLKRTGLGGAQLLLLNKKGEVAIDYDPSTQNANDAVVHDIDNTLLKTNLLANKNEAALALSRGEEGTLVTTDPRTGLRYLNAYSAIGDPRFIDELGWTLLFRIHDEVLLNRILQSREKFFLISGIVLILCIGASSFFALRLSRRLRGISDSIAHSGNSVDTVSAQLSAASQELSSGATEVASSLQETVSSLEELTSMVRNNAENAGEAASLAQNSSRIAKDGEAEVHNLIGAIGEINQSSKKIEEIITVIDDIAFQTNLLALNAAVEAARAGEQGKGFAVVAEAVRNLAQRSGTAAKEITGLIRDNVEKIDRGTKIADRSGQVLQNILSSVRKVADLNNEIAAASKEQSSGLSQISKAMNEIDQATQRNAAASEEVASSSEEMNSQASSLQSMVHELSDVVNGADKPVQTGSVTPPPAPKSSATPARKASNVTTLKRPPARRPSKAPAGSAAPQTAKSHAATVIPFGDEESDEPEARISSTAGF